MAEKNKSLKKIARYTGVLYLAVILTSVYAHIYVPSQILVRGDAAATTTNILSNEFLFRTCVAVSLAEVVLLLFVALGLSRLFSQVNNQLTKMMVALVNVQVPVTFVLAAFKIISLMIAKGEIATPFSPSHLPDVVMLFLKLNEYGMMALQLIWGLWLLPFAILVYKSRFIPRIFGAVLLFSGIAYIFSGLTYILLPAFHIKIQMLAYVSALGEISIMLWLLISGVKEHISINIESELVPVNSSPVMAPVEAF